MASGDWDPMLSDYQDPQFNRYHQGVGRDLSDGKWKGSRLFVDNFPTDLGQEGFVNLFSECGHVIEAKLKPSNRADKRFTFGFITMDSAVSAEYAISRLNQRTFRSGMQPLKVMPALTDEEKKRRQESKEMEANFMSSIRGNFNRDDDMMSSVSTYAMRPDPLYDQRGFAPRNPGILDRPEYGGGRGFRPDMKNYEMMERRGLFMMGRGRAQALRDPQPFFREMMGDYPKAYLGGRGRGRGQFFHNDRPRQRPNCGLTFGRGLGQHDMQMNIPRKPQHENLKICVCCGTEGSSHRCGVCKMYYCSPQCQRKDWANNHREICLDISIHRFKMQTQMEINSPPTFGTTTQQKDHWDRESGVDSGNKFKQNDKNYDTDSGKPVKVDKNLKQNGRRYESESGNKTQSAPKNVKQGNKNRSTETIPKETKGKYQEMNSESNTEPILKETGKYQEKNSERNTETIPKETKGRYQEKNSEKNPQGRGSYKEKEKREPRVFRSSRNDDVDNDKDSVKKDAKNDSDKRNGQGKLNQKKQGLDKSQQKKKTMESDILSVWEGDGEKRVSSKKEIAKSPNKAGEVRSKAANLIEEVDGSGDASIDLIGQTIDIGISGKCFIAHYESPAKLWIILKEDISDFFQLSDRFKLVLEQMPKGSVKRVKAGELYCIIHDGFWTRVKVMTVNGNKISVFFPDVGRQETVNISDLYPLDETMRFFPSQAICCCLGKVKPIGKNTWNEKSKDVVETWLGEPYVKELSFKVIEKKGSSHALKISYNGEDLGETLVSQGLAEVAGTGANLPKLSNDDEKPKSVKKIERFMAKDLKSQASCLEEDQQVYINITDFASPSKFMGHIITTETKEVKCCIEKIMKEMNLDTGKPYRKESERVYNKLIVLADKLTGIGGERDDTEKREAQEGEERDETLSVNYYYDFILSPMLGELVLAKFSADNTWYRSEVIKVRGDNFEVLFVDYGNKEQLTSKDIRQIEDKTLVTYPALASCLELWNVPADTNTDDLVDELGGLLEDFSMEEGQWSIIVKSKRDSFMLVDFVAWTQDDSLSTVLREKLSQKSEKKASKIKTVLSPKADGAKVMKVADLSADTLPSDQKTEVVVNFVNSCASFYVMLKSNYEKLHTLMMDINTRVESVPVIKKPVAGSLVLAQYAEDKTWYRAQVKSVKNLEKCTVFFLDYGNSEEVAIEGLRQLPSWANSQPTMAIHCGLNVETVKLAHDADETFKVIEGKIVNVSVLKKQGDGGKCVVKMVTEEGSDLLEPLAVDLETQEQTAIPDANLDPGVKIKVVCVRVVCRKEFYVQVSSQIPGLNQSTVERGQLVSKNAERLTKVKESDFVAAQYSKDRKWHRVRVEDVKGKECSVFFIDYGYMENITISSLRKLPERDFSFPACTVTCALKNCIPGQKLDNYFVTEAEKQIDSIRVCGEDDCFKLVDIFDHNGVCITDKFTGKNASPAVEAKKTSSPQKSHAPTSGMEHKDVTIKIDSIFETNEPVRTLVVYIQSVCDFYICGTKLEELDVIMKGLQTKAPSEPLLKELHVGAFCTARFEDDKLWYRAQISSVHDESCVVKFIDYGNSQKTKKNELRQLPDFARSLPAMAVPCCFKEFESYIGQEQNHEELTSIHKSEQFDKLKEEVFSIPVFVTLHRHRSGVAVVSLADADGNDVLKKHKIKLSSCPVTGSPSCSDPPTITDIPVARVNDSNFEVIFTNLETLSEFCCERNNNVKKALEISESLERDLINVGHGKCKPVVNGVYGCLFENVWYRCVVEEIQDDKVTLRYIDWGNMEERLAVDLRPLQAKHLTYPVSLMKCKLHGIEIVDNSIEKVQEYIEVLNKQLETNRLCLDVKGEEGEFCLVSLAVVNDENASVDIANDLVEVGIAKSSYLKSIAQSQTTRQEMPEEEEEDEDDREMEVLKKKMELIQLRKSKKK